MVDILMETLLVLGIILLCLLMLMLIIPCLFVVFNMIGAMIGAFVFGNEKCKNRLTFIDSKLEK